MRLTHYDEHKKRWQINDDYGAVMIDELNYAVGEAIDKLAAYEDMGLEPDEIKENIGLLSPICIGCDGKTADGKRTEKCTYVDDDFRKCLERSVHLSELALAEEQGLLVRLPCKVGDTVYAIERFCDGNKGDCYSWLECEECKDYQQEVIERRIGTLSQAVSVIEMLGKTVFLSREEAEASLRGETR